MTAIVGVLNGNGIAFAADSATTHTISHTHKITNDANKIFSLSNYYPVGVATYNNTNLYGVAWEDLFKLYRETYLKDRSYPTLKEYVYDFMEYIKSKIVPKLKTEEDANIDSAIKLLYAEIKGKAVKAIKSTATTVTEDALYREMLNQLSSITENYKDIKTSDGLQNYNIKDFVTYSSPIFDLAYSNIEKQPCTPEFKTSFLQTLYTVLVSTVVIYRDFTGIVFWGYGEEELFPSYFDIHTNMAFDGQLKYFLDNEYHADGNRCCIVPFAQSDVANTVIRGIDQSLRDEVNKNIKESSKNLLTTIINVLKTLSAPEAIVNALSAINTDALSKPFIDNINQYIQENYVKKLMDTTGYLTKEDMAEMAESLVKMTCLKRKVTTDEETVGGPVDVAVATRGDGFIWIKRKHYFKPELNHQFFERHKL